MIARIEAISVGNELLSGDLADAHVRRFGAFFRARGLQLTAAQTVPDDVEAIGSALALAMQRADLVLVTGGLGSTSDDRTAEAVAATIGVERVEDLPSVEAIRDRIHRMGRTPTDAQLGQALIPQGATALWNRAGSAPGVHLEHEGTHVFLFPGVPAELDAIMTDHLQPWVDAHMPIRPLHSRIFKTFGETESGVASRLEGVRWDGAHVAYRATFPEIHITLYLEEADAGRAEERLALLSREVRERLDGLIYGEGARASLPSAVGQALSERGLTLALAESCTGGLLAKELTEVTGASAWFLEGLVTYSNEAKTRLLGVSAELLQEHGAVSEPVAVAMAQGARGRAGADLGIGITGIAGPTGGTPDKPVGTVHVALSTPQETVHRLLKLPFDRNGNRQVSVSKALQMILRSLRAQRDGTNT